ncbi:indolepyruvate oxidoreductase subunit beta family protein [Bradyrhizobium sp. AUGA SZCCT0177]|uniref:indolepyruvate oxidoreductase subunit beta family protein n=1 Tax=Bradyrhizobium sp. AUGA SZCCT0177 TaxID=2807665 RepID=UPI001BA8DC01|nr:indolepyruvate oxidoreductase subunit beta family protein [Bradyrhizobium sp. AUGA SZCCT0177]MBR1282004.1 indolepyruvate oxidoreductase subunit beta family protein [Bradyrhizobium sp. AUGA SZCCT0177]
MNIVLQPLAIDLTRPLSIAVLAMGGQGGGVLVDWIVALAESQNWIAQSTSVPGVAQRTGATIYYVEMIPARADAAYPVLSLMPVPGEVDVVVGAELMEAGRAIQRGLVTPDKTTLIASSHRSFAVQEKLVPGDGISDSSKVYEAAEATAKRFVAFDMAVLADSTGSAISAVLFGALAGSGALPFGRKAYEATIRAAGIGIEPSLRAFAAGFERTQADAATATPPAPPKPASAGKLYPALAPIGDSAFDALVTDASTTFPTSLHGIIAAGLRKVVDFQDVSYGREYLDLVAGFMRLEHGSDPALTRAAAKHVAVAMAYDDVIRVADLKTRASRFERVRGEVLAKPDQLVYTTEFMHPRMEEVLGTLPAGLGLWLEGKPGLCKRLDRLVNRGRRVQTGTVRWFLPLYVLGGLKRFRRGTLRHQREVAHRDAWLDLARTTAAKDYELAVAILEARRLVKGYSDTHARGASKFDRVIAVAPRLAGRADGGQWLRRLCKAALADEEGKALDGALATVETFL